MKAEQLRENTGSKHSRLFSSYCQLAKSLLPTVEDACLLNPSLQILGSTRRMPAAQVARWFKAARSQDRAKVLCTRVDQTNWVSAISLEQADGRFLGAFCVRQTLSTPPAQPSKHLRLLQQVLKPLLDCIHRDLAASHPRQSRLRTLTERSEELEWLFKLTGDLHGAACGARLMERLVSAAAARLEAGLGAISVPDKRLSIECCLDAESAPVLKAAWDRGREQVLAWAQRQHRPLILNRSSREKDGNRSCKLLAVPILRDSGFVIGVLTFVRSPTDSDFADSQLFLAGHLGRQAAQLVERQFDLTTGLYTRGGLEEMSGPVIAAPAEEHSLIYLDVDHMHVVNELHGFAIGNELIVRLAGLLDAPLLPQNALAARIESDRFAIMLPSCTLSNAASIAQAIVDTSGRIVLGPAENTIEISVSSGVAPFIADLPSAFQRALAAAELACKTAKTRGRRRVEIYAFEDASMMRYHADALSVGKLREALKGDRFVLYAQPIVPLNPHDSDCAYEILLRFRDDDGSLVSASEFMAVATRYQLLPSIDRWVCKRALELLAPYRSMLSTRGIGMSINVTGQSISDESFVVQLARQLKEARLPADCITIEITEQAAVGNLARANELITLLKSSGCQFALDDFGTGANSLTTLNGLQISKIKIDGSFVRKVATDRHSHSTVRAIVELARGLSIDTVAEYVETPEIAVELRRLGVDYAQGYAFGRPAPLAAILQSLNAEESERLHRLYLEA